MTLLNLPTLYTQGQNQSGSGGAGQGDKKEDKVGKPDCR